MPLGWVHATPMPRTMLDPSADSSRKADIVATTTTFVGVTLFGAIVIYGRKTRKDGFLISKAQVIEVQGFGLVSGC